jgi:hypothetical protein
VKTALAALLVLALSSAALAVPRQTGHAGARVVDSFGDLRPSDLMARLDNFAVELHNSPGARGVVAAYAGKNKFPGWPMRRSRMAVDYLVDDRGVEASRLSVFNGGPRGETALELWLVPPGAELPLKPFDAALLMSGEKSPLLFDRFVVVERGDEIVSAYGLEPEPDAAGNYGYFAEVLRRDPSLRGCVIAYTWRRGARSAGRRLAARAKMTIAESHAVDVARVVAVGGGRREYKTIELWLVPPGAPLPRPTPEPPPASRTRR